MKIKVEVDLSEFYSEDEELTFTEQIKDAMSDFAIDHNSVIEAFTY